MHKIRPPNDPGISKYLKMRRLYGIIMKKLILPVLVSIAMISIIWYTAILPSPVSQNNNQDVKPGQIWIYEHKNPFETITYESTVIDVKEGYVKYKQEGFSEASVSSINWFKINSRLKK